MLLDDFVSVLHTYLEKTPTLQSFTCRVEDGDEKYVFWSDGRTVTYRMSIFDDKEPLSEKAVEHIKKTLCSSISNKRIPKVSYENESNVGQFELTRD